MVLAAGKGTRMQSARPKPLHLLCGKPMVVYVLDALAGSDVHTVSVVVGTGAERVVKKLHAEAGGLPLTFVEQVSQRGTGDAAAVGLTGLPPDEGDDDPGDVIVLPGDTPLLEADTIARLVDHHRGTDAACTILTARLDDPTGYGRIVRGKEDRVERIVEQADAAPAELAIDEVNTSIYCFKRGFLAPALRRISPDNAQGELYLTDAVSVLVGTGNRVEAIAVEDPAQTAGVNDRIQLSGAEAALRRRTNLAWMRAGVTMLDPASTYLDTTVQLSPDVTLFPNVLLQGRTVVGEGTEIGPDVRLVDCAIGAGSRVSSTTARDAEVGPGSVVGPYAVLEPGAQIPSDTVTGPFYTALSSEGDAD